MNLGGSCYGDVDYYGDVAAHSGCGVALKAPTIPVDGPCRARRVVGSPARRLCAGIEHAARWRGDQTKVPGGGCTAMRTPAVLSARGLLGSGACCARPALILEGEAEAVDRSGRCALADVVPVPPMSVTSWEVERKDVVWTDLDWLAIDDFGVCTTNGDTLAVPLVRAKAGRTTTRTLITFWPFEVIDGMRSPATSRPMAST